ncbi:DUF192 domain-containing protein [Paraglaciecola marina]|uniref:DUF192 domain-containing protein n=1 Tax=Paraglaciecola marina TaxID=2500157 RepID=UPI001061AA61|nr:DUF192 domain-containing protein [Paraglaciecola marina]
MRVVFNVFVLLSCFVLFSSFNLHAQTISFGEIQVKVNGKAYQLEYADTFEKRAQGLMNRESLCETCGMLFKFKQPKVAGFWMKDTLIPLDIAFVKADGTITDIKSMKALDLNSTNSSDTVLYAWEMNKGWFAKNNIKVGDTVVICAIN